MYTRDVDKEKHQRWLVAGVQQVVLSMQQKLLVIAQAILCVSMSMSMSVEHDVLQPIPLLL